MSIVSTYVYLGSAKFLENPIIQFDEGFICFDDEEPPEIVLKKTHARNRDEARLLARACLLKLRIPYACLRVITNSGLRCFCPGIGMEPLRPAWSMFFRLTGPVSSKTPVRRRKVVHFQRIEQGTFEGCSSEELAKLVARYRGERRGKNSHNGTSRGLP
jgi:hypothetical protein